MEQKPIEITHEETHIGPPLSSVNLEDVVGNIPRVTSVPTWTPRLFKDGFAIYANGATLRFYVYDYVGTTWRYAGLT